MMTSGWTLRFCARALPLLALLLAPRALRAETVDQRLSEARAQFQQLEYERAIRLLRPIVELPRATKRQKIDALELLGLSELTLGRERKAREAFENLLSLDPRHKLHDPSGSPKLRQFYEAVKRSFIPDYKQAARPGARIEHTPPETATAGHQIVLRARIEGGERSLSSVVVRWRRSRDRAYHTVRMRGTSERLEARLLAPRSAHDYVIVYFLEALDSGGQPLARRGQPENPLELTVEGSGGAPPRSGRDRRDRAAPPFYTRWWFWTLIGVAVAGGVAATAAVLANQGVPDGTLPPGVVDLSLVHWR